MELRQIIRTVWKWLWLIVLATVIAAMASFIASSAAVPLYATRTTIMIGRSIQNPDPNSADLWTGQQLALTYIQLVKREPIMKAALESIGLQIPWQSIANQVNATAIAQTQLVEITVIDSNPYRAKSIADAVANQLVLQSPASKNGLTLEQAVFAENQITDLQNKITAAYLDIDKLRLQRDAATSSRQIQDLSNQITILENKITDWQKTYSQLILSIKGGDANALSIVEEASVPTAPFSPNMLMNVLTAAIIGFILSLGGAFLIEFMDDTIKSPEDIERIVPLAILGTITMIEGEDYHDKLISLNQPRSPIAEAFRVLRTNMRFSAVDKPLRSVMLTSPGPGEGKSVTLANLAVATAQAGLKVIVVDTDLRRPVQHRLFNVANRQGLTDAILHPALGVEEFLQKTEIENIRILTTGPLPPNPSELLASERMQEIITALMHSADFVFFDSPPSLILADAAILATRVDGVILVSDYGNTRLKEIKNSVFDLQRGHANLIGLVLNRLPVKGNRYYYHYYYSNGERKKSKRSLAKKFFQKNETFGEDKIKQ